jgi:hypothetical protein
MIASKKNFVPSYTLLCYAQEIIVFGIEQSQKMYIQASIAVQTLNVQNQIANSPFKNKSLQYNFMKL